MENVQRCYGNGPLTNEHKYILSKPINRRREAINEQDAMLADGECQGRVTSEA